MTARAAPTPPITSAAYNAAGNGYGIATATDGTIYVTQTGGPGPIVKFSGGIAVVIPLPQPYRWPGTIARGSDGAMWYGQQIPGPPTINSIGRLDSSGNFASYDVPPHTPLPLSEEPGALTLAPDGNVWFTEYSEGQVGRISPSGSYAEYSLGSAQHRPTGIAVASDGNLWIAEMAGQIDRIALSGTVLASYPTGNFLSFHITQGPDGRMWFVDGHNIVGRIDANGIVEAWILPCDIPNIGNFCLPGYFQGPTDIVSGPDGNLWFPAQNFQAVARLTPTGILTEWSVAPTSNGLSSPQSMTVFQNKIFFVGGGNMIGTITP